MFDLPILHMTGALRLAAFYRHAEPPRPVKKTEVAAMLQAVWPLPLLRHGDFDIFDLIEGLSSGSILMWIALVVVLGSIGFFAIFEKVTGKSFVKSKEERRRARERRKHVIWKYERDD
jgi:hypothetical protein